ncbi:MAG TPA: PQQ-binding-like beta-propeller repeat protein [Candidatus Dormibacteraeota bacterium]|nr:PQQ-binding-like beta-propeller repeat protein [Candidatus Dormibacteraeota bacterium]
MPRPAARVSAVFFAAIALLLGAGTPAGATGSAFEWPQLQGGNARTGSNSVQTALTATTAPSLHLAWSFNTASSVSGEPVAANGLVYFGARDGNLRAVDRSGNLIWSTFVGMTSAPCNGATVNQGIGGSPALTLGPPSLVYVGGGDGWLYALDALTGSIVWKTQLAVPPAGFLWSSPAVFGGSVYEGVASLDDCPLVRGALARLDASTGAVQNVRWIAPQACLGATIWASPAIDEARGIVYVATGNAGPCPQPEIGSTAIIALRASDLGVLGYWQVPGGALPNSDSDFGATPTLFSAVINGQPRDLIGVANKNGVYYVLDRTNLPAGPVWQETIALSGEDPTAGQGSISASAFDGTSLYIGGGGLPVKGSFCGGTLRAVDPATGQVRWYVCAPAPILAPVSATPGLVVVSAAGGLAVLTSDTARLLFIYRNTRGGVFWGGTAISEGVLYAGSTDGYLYAFAPA